MARLSRSLAVCILFAWILSLNLVSSSHVSFADSDYTPSVFIQVPQATLYMSPAKVAGLEGQTVMVKANIAQVTNLYAFQIGLWFDPNVTECISVEDGGFLSRNGADFTLPAAGQINNTTGRIIPYGWTLIDPAKAKNGSGTLAQFTFRMKTTDYSNVHFDGFKAVNSSTLLIPVKIVDSYTPIRVQTENSISIAGNAQGQIGSGYSNFSLRSFPPLKEYHEFNFNITGAPINGNPFAFFNVSIPKNLLWGDYDGNPNQGWLVTLNGQLDIIKALYENATHTSVYFEFNYSTMNPTTHVVVGTWINLEQPYPDAELVVFTDNWWYTHGDRVTIKGRFTIDNVAIGGGTVLMSVVYPNMSVLISYFNITEPNGNASFTFQIGQNAPFGNYSIQLLAGKLGVPGAYAVKHFLVMSVPLIDPYPGQHVYYRASQYDTSNNLLGSGWFNTSYVGYFAPNMMNCSINYLISGVYGTSGSDWVGINTTTRQISTGTSDVGSFFDLWIQTNVTIGSQIAISNTVGTVTGSEILMFRMDDGTIGYVDWWKVEYTDVSLFTVQHTAYFDKKMGINVYEKVVIASLNTVAYIKASDINIPLGYNWGDINHDQTVNGTDTTLIQAPWQTTTGTADFNVDADFNLDGIIDINDLTIIGLNWQHQRTVIP